MSTTFHIDGRSVSCDVQERKHDHVRFTYNGTEYTARGSSLSDGSFVLEIEDSPGFWLRVTGVSSNIARSGTMLQIGQLDALVSTAQGQAGGGAQEARLSPLAPMPGMVRQVLVKKGDGVAAGDALVVVEAMKLQLTLSAGGDATVDSVLVSEGQMVAEGAELVKLTPKATD